MGRPLRIAALHGAAAVTLALLAGCGRAADPARAAGPAPEPPAQALPDNAAAVAPPRWATGEDAAAFMVNVAALERIRARMRSAALLQAPGMGALPGEKAALSAALFRERPAAIPEGATAAGAAAIAGDQSFYSHISFEGDTSWFVYDDSAYGRVHWIHAFHDADGDTYGLVRDSLVYRWPFPPAVAVGAEGASGAAGAPILTASHSRLLRYDGVIFESGLSDGDGDGDLNGPAPAGAAETAYSATSAAISGSARQRTGLRRRKLSVVALGDSAWKSEWLLEYGAIDPTGEGAIVSFSESLFVKGAAVAGRRSFDGDGDGLAFRGPPGAPMVVRTEAFHPEADGVRIHIQGAYGQGADGDYFAAVDNPVYPFTVAVLTAAGDTLSVHAYGDADGDGYYADPAAGAANRVWKTGRYPEREGCESFRDSLVKTLGEPGDLRDDRVALYRADAVLRDGDSTVAIGRIGKDGTVAYASLLPGGGRASGVYDPGTGLFRDTLAFALDAEGGYEFCEGVYRASDGTGDFTLNRRPAQGAGNWTRMILAADGPGGFALAVIHDPDNGTYSIRGDTVTWNTAYGDTLAAFKSIREHKALGALLKVAAHPDFTDLFPGDGAYRLLESVSDGEGRMLAEADFRFGPDLAGRGMFRDLTADPVSPVEIHFSAGGSARVEEMPGALQTR